MEQFTIRLAAFEDMGQIWDLVRRAVAAMNAEGNEQWGRDYPTMAHYQADLDRGELYCAVRPDGQILGVSCINQEEDPAYAGVRWSVSGPAMSVHRTAVDPQFQRSGVAQGLLTRAVALAREAGAASMRVDTYQKNRKMQRLFAKLGFCKRGEIHLHGRELPFFAFELLL